MTQEERDWLVDKFIATKGPAPSDMPTLLLKTYPGGIVHACYINCLITNPPEIIWVDDPHADYN